MFRKSVLTAVSMMVMASSAFAIDRARDERKDDTRNAGVMAVNPANARMNDQVSFDALRQSIVADPSKVDNDQVAHQNAVAFDQKIAAYEQQGMSPELARLQALRELPGMKNVSDDKLEETFDSACR